MIRIIALFLKSITTSAPSAKAQDKTTSDYSLAGGKYYLKGECSDAIKDYNEAITLDPDNASAYISRGITKFELEKYFDAIKDYDKFISLAPDFAFAYNNRGLVKADLGHYSDAIEDYDKAIALDPNYALAHNNRNIAKRKLRQSGQ